MPPGEARPWGVRRRAWWGLHKGADFPGRGSQLSARGDRSGEGALWLAGPRGRRDRHVPRGGAGQGALRAAASGACGLHA